jgi:hypothetical protein
MTETKRDEFRDQAAFAALAGILARGEHTCKDAAINAYRHADALLAARVLPGRYEKFVEDYKREAEREEKERAESVARRNMLAPLHEWAKTNWDSRFMSVVFDFITEHKPKDGEDIVKAFKDWIRQNRPSFIDRMKREDCGFVN